MKAFFALAALCVLAGVCRADLVIEQQMSSPFMNGTLTYKIKGDLSRIDMPSPMGGNVTTIINGTSGEMTTLMHAQKMAMKANLATLKQKGDAMLKKSGVDPAATSKPVATGNSGKVGAWDAEEYTWSTGGVNMRFWAAKDFPDAARVKTQMVAAAKAMANAGPNPYLLDVPGVIVKSEVDTQAGKVTTTMVSAKEVPIPASDFAIPEGYASMPMPLPQ